MAISATNLTFGQTTAGVTSANTASISPSANALVIVSVYGGLNSGVAATVTGAGGTWVQICYADDNGGSGGNHCVQLFRDLSASPGSGALTISFGSTSENNLGWSVDQFTGTDTTGTHGSGAIVQTVLEQDGTGGTDTGVTITLAALGSANNAAYGFIRLPTSLMAISVGSGFTQLSYQDPTGGASSSGEWAINKTAVAWTWPSTSVSSRIGAAIEIKAATAAASPFSTRLGPIPFGMKAYIDASNLYGNGILPHIIQTRSSTFLNLIENAAPFNTKSYRDYLASPLNPNLFPPASVQPFVNIWISKCD
jgi:hypothetical protein